MSCRSPRAAETFNRLYPQVRSMMSQMGCSGHVKVFFDGSAVIDLIVTSNNCTVNLSISVTTKLDKEGRVIGYRYADSERLQECGNLGEVLQLAHGMVYRTKTVLNKV